MQSKNCFVRQENWNRESLETFKQNIRDYVKSPETERINGSYRYADLAYHYMKPKTNLVVSVNVTNNEYISIRNATRDQLGDLLLDGNLGYNTRPSRSLMLSFLGSK